MNSRILLVFPPLSALVTHPELGMPQLFATLVDRGFAARQLDLNAEFVYRHLLRREVLGELLAELPPSLQGALTHLVGELNDRRAAYLQRLWELGLPTARRTDAERAVQWHLDGAETLLPRGFAQDLRPTTPDSSLDELHHALTSGALARTAGARLVELVQRALVQPADFAPGSVRAKVAHPAPLLDRFFTESFDPHLTETPLLVGLSIHATRQLVPALQLAARVKRTTPGAVVLAGGPWCIAARHVLATQPEVLFEHVDGYVVDEGDTAIVRVGEALRGGGEVPDVPALIRRGHTPPPPLTPAPRPDLDDLSAPRFDGLPFHLYPTPLVPFRTLRGCYWGRCRFCFHLRPDDVACPPPARAHAMSPGLLDQLVETLRRADREHGVHRWTTADNATPPGHLLQIARALTAAGIRSEWSSLARFDPEFTPELCREVAAAGCRELQLGLETSSVEGWKRLHKGLNHEVVQRTLDACASAGIEATVFVLDYPSQAPHEFRETLEFVAEHHPRIARFIPLRFELGRNSRAFEQPDLLGLDLPPAAEQSLDVFGLPFTSAGWQSSGEHRAIWDEFALRLIAQG